MKIFLTVLFLGLIAGPAFSRSVEYMSREEIIFLTKSQDRLFYTEVGPQVIPKNTHRYHHSQSKAQFQSTDYNLMMQKSELKNNQSN